MPKLTVWLSPYNLHTPLCCLYDSRTANLESIIRDFV